MKELTLYLLPTTQRSVHHSKDGDDPAPAGPSSTPSKMPPKRSLRSNKKSTTPVASSSSATATHTPQELQPLTKQRITKIKLVNKRAAYKSFKPLLRKSNGQEALILLDKFGGGSSEHSLAFKPREQGAHADPWVLLGRKEGGAAGRATTNDAVLKRMRANAAAANAKVDEIAIEAGSGAKADSNQMAEMMVVSMPADQKWQRY